MHCYYLATPHGIAMAVLAWPFDKKAIDTKTGTFDFDDK